MQINLRNVSINHLVYFRKLESTLLYEIAFLFMFRGIRFESIIV